MKTLTRDSRFSRSPARRMEPFRRSGAWGLLPLSMLLLLLFAAAPAARAQLQVALKLDKKTYMAHEPITGVLTLLNRAGRDIVIDNPARGVWLDYSIHDPRQNLISPVSRREVLKPLVLRSGIPSETRVVVNKEFPMGESGMYRVRARVYFPPLDHYYETTPQTLNIVDGQTLWGPETVGIPTGFPEAGAYVPVDAGRYTLEVSPSGMPVVALEVPDVALEAGTVYTVFAMGRLPDMSLEPVIAAASPEPRSRWMAGIRSARTGSSAALGTDLVAASSVARGSAQIAPGVMSVPMRRAAPAMRPSSAKPRRSGWKVSASASATNTPMAAVAAPVTEPSTK